MSFDFTPFEMQEGYTVPLVLDMLPGSPVVHLEHLGLANKSYVASQIAAATAAAEEIRKDKRKIGRKVDTAITFKDADQDIIEKRADLHHAIRNLEGFHSDGVTPASSKDIPDFISAIPKHIVVLLWNFCQVESNFYRKAANPSDVAKK